MGEICGKRILNRILRWVEGRRGYEENNNNNNTVYIILCCQLLMNETGMIRIEKQKKNTAVSKQLGYHLNPSTYCLPQASPPYL